MIPTYRVTGLSNGTVTYRNLARAPAPSDSAASYSSRGMLASAAEYGTTPTAGMVRTDDRMTDHSATLDPMKLDGSLTQPSGSMPTKPIRELKTPHGFAFSIQRQTRAM